MAKPKLEIVEMVNQRELDLEVMMDRAEEWLALAMKELDYGDVDSAYAYLKKAEQALRGG